MRKFVMGVTYTVKPGLREEFIQKVVRSGLLEKIRREDGCLGYEYYCSMENAEVVFLMEQWDSEEQQKVHLKQPHMELLKTIKNCYVVDTHVEEYFSVK